jgi:hypothetical protein
MKNHDTATTALERIMSHYCPLLDAAPISLRLSMSIASFLPSSSKRVASRSFSTLLAIERHFLLDEY